MPRTMAGDCEAEYLFVPAVWWTTENLMRSANEGGARTIDSSAPQSGRRTIVGASGRRTAVAVAAVGRAARLASTAVTGLETKNVRSRVTVPEVRYWIQRASPVHHGLPILQAGETPPSGAARSGRSSSSACATCHALHRPGSAAVRNAISPGP